MRRRRTRESVAFVDRLGARRGAGDDGTRGPERQRRRPERGPSPPTPPLGKGERHGNGLPSGGAIVAPSKPTRNGRSGGRRPAVGRAAAPHRANDGRFTAAATAERSRHRPRHIAFGSGFVRAQVRREGRASRPIGWRKRSRRASPTICRWSARLRLRTRHRRRAGRRGRRPRPAARPSRPAPAVARACGGQRRDSGRRGTGTLRPSRRRAGPTPFDAGTPTTRGGARRAKRPGGPATAPTGRWRCRRSRSRRPSSRRTRGSRRGR